MVHARQVPDLVLPTHWVPEPAVREMPAPPRSGLREVRIDAAVFGGGALAEVALGGAAVVLSIFGLAGVAPTVFAAIATIAVGSALVAYSGAVVLRGREVLERVRFENVGLVEIVGGIGSEVMGGGGAILLAILALLGVDPGPLLAVAAIGLGGGALYGGAAQGQLDVVAAVPDPRRNAVSIRAMRAGSAILVVTGCLAATLGILGVVDVAPNVVLVLVATLALGVAIALAGAASAYRFGVPWLQRAGYV